MKNKIKNIYFLVRVFLMKLLYKTLTKLGRITLPEDDLNKNKGMSINDNLCFYQVINLNVGYFDYHWKSVSWEMFKKKELKIATDCGEPNNIYDWDKLKESIAKEGLKRRLIAVFDIKNTGDTKFRLVDGNHRLRCLEDLYGKDYIVEVDAYVPFNYLDIIKTLKLQNTKLHTSRLNTIKNKTY